MPTAIWRSTHNNSIDQIFNTSTFPQIVAGILVSGGAKQGKRRALWAFDLTTDPDDGERPEPGAAITDAALLLNVNQLDGIGGGASHIARITRDDWDGTSSWNNYHAITTDIRPWTTPGGDFDSATWVAFTAPNALGAFQIPGLLALAQEAIDNHDAQLSLIAKIDGETGSFTSEFWCDATGDTRGRLQLTFAAGATIDRRDDATLTGIRPARPGPPSGAHRPASPARPARLRS